MKRDLGYVGDDAPTLPLRRPAKPDASQTVLTVDELADLLEVDRKSVYAAIQRGEIPGVRRVGRSIRACRTTVLAWLRDGQGPAERSSTRSKP